MSINLQYAIDNALYYSGWEDGYGYALDTIGQTNERTYPTFFPEGEVFERGFKEGYNTCLAKLNLG